ncbi:hypothetical protein RJ639_034104 [Escallonia herrerae]|uniref:Uncharacterized protein n=1 Tax=Escallonia herrerae TaxID=1293975 RepID=A0AA88X1L3_9ASTE|nr:hypothetical protein RJ639_034104 [Escallonia herrerae]
MFSTCVHGFAPFIECITSSLSHFCVDSGLALLFALKDMDTSNPAVFVNAELLRMYVGRRVRAVIQVVRLDAGVVIGKSTDEQQLLVKGQPPSPLTTFVEVIGIADSNQSIRAEIWTNFGDTFDTQNYNQVCLLANGEFKHLFI